MKWELLTYKEIDAFDRDTPVFLNIGAIEQHGPHLPVSVDAAIGEHFLNAFDTLDLEAQLILPQVAVGCSSHHLDFAGTLSVPHSVMMHYVCSILDSVVNSGFRKMVLFNSNGGNQAIGRVIVEHFGKQNPQCLIAMLTWWEIAQEQLAALSDTGAYGTGHACEFETSIMMAIGAVPSDTKLPTGEYRNALFEWSDSTLLQASTASVYRSMKDITGGSGVFGQPDAASIQKGKKITEIVLSALSTYTSDIRNYTLPH